MNDEARKFWRHVTALPACAAILGGCAQMTVQDPFPEAPVDTASPLAAEIAKEAATPGDYPRFADIPAIPTDVRSPAEWGVAVGDVLDARQTLLAETAPSTWTLNDTDAFAASITAQADVRPGDVPTDAEIAESEAFARKLRERATPPPRPR